MVGLLLLVPLVNHAVSGPFWFFTKVVALFYLMVWLRGTFPRFRYDQLMNIGWKVLIPLGLAAVLVNGMRRRSVTALCVPRSVRAHLTCPLWSARQYIM